MASGNIDYALHAGYTLRLTWSETATNATANTSTVKVVAKLITGSGYINSSVAKNISITCNGSTQKGTCMVAIKQNQTKDLFTATFTVAHNADGSKTVAISCSIDIKVTLGSSYYGTVTWSGNAVLSKIARNPNAPTTFTITAGHGNYVGLGDTINMSWSGASGVITGYEIQYLRGNSGWNSHSNLNVTSTKTSGTWTDQFASNTDLERTGAGKVVQYRIRAKNGSLTSAWKESNKLYMSGGMDLKVSGAWKTGTVWIKVSGSWKRAKRVWVKVGGAWKESK